MSPIEITDALESNGAVFSGLLHRVPGELQTFRIRPDHSCLLEIACHLHDIERDDFGARIQSIFDDPTQPLPPTDPPEWFISRRYMEQEYTERVDAFLAARRDSVAWLRSMDSVNWDQAYNHPTVGPVSARLLLANWLAHDHLHIRQITKVTFFFLQATTDVRFDYAGDW